MLIDIPFLISPLDFYSIPHHTSTININQSLVYRLKYSLNVYLRADQILTSINLFQVNKLLNFTFPGFTGNNSSTISIHFLFIGNLLIICHIFLLITISYTFSKYIKIIHHVFKKKGDFKFDFGLFFVVILIHIFLTLAELLVCLHQRTFYIFYKKSFPSKNRY